MTRNTPRDGTPRDGPAVERLTVSVYRIPTDLPGGDATLTWDATTLVLVEVTAAGVTGLGYTYGSPATAAVVEQTLSDRVVGQDAFDVPAANDRMSRALRNAGRPGTAAGVGLRGRHRPVGPETPARPGRAGCGPSPPCTPC
ncbi:hypothetical protein ROS62_19685 [Streptomyces sp. DSM 41972]|uniref:Mandelate racemase/muconate lactonizing enzyme N-terminal domain-containing protein n=1 Tax=Streptomyces althioticus subsp. attaecolombicae TaxID=3075534 RepID=A0ABU3I1Z9_9ACTN|nr:hypothetical protein [Streptomyces sp. DSM 41972]SCD92041.1 Mandelate racemase / muconate lactonizing enzyme, N-terminal domain [Streptomyces sp. di50b]SCE37873.1 Mandelate racemase / muconate lactonizing enzyme, N-terminal domain [Streptomyces sp. di188]